MKRTEVLQGLREMKFLAVAERWERGAFNLLPEKEMATDQDGWIFPSKRSKSGHIEGMDEAFARCVKAAKLDLADRAAYDAA
jgi:hypothetical protein